MESRHSSPLLRGMLLAGGASVGCLLAMSIGLILLISLVVALVGGTAPSGGGPTVITASHEWTGLRNQPVVDRALHIAAGLYDGPPDGLDTWYHADQIADALAYWNKTCPGFCGGSYRQGNLQCVMLITAAYGLANQPLPFVGNAITFWTSGIYQTSAGWEAVPPNDMPYPGDILVLDSGQNFEGVGHVAIVVDVKPPHAKTGAPGYIQIAEANGPNPLTQLALTRGPTGSLHLVIWKGYTTMGYLRHSIALTEGAAHEPVS